MTDTIRPNKEVIQLEFENFLESVDNLSTQQKQELTQKLIGENSPLTVVLDANDSISLPISEKSGKIAEKLATFPPETIANITEAIAIWMKQNKSPSNH